MMSLSRRRFLGTAALTAGAAVPGLSIDGLGKAAAQAPARPFTWVSTGGSWGEAVDRIFIRNSGFAATLSQPAVHAIEVDTIATSKILVACGHPPFDVGSSTQADYLLLENSGCLDSYDMNVVTNFNDIYPQLRLGNYYATINVAALGVAWNTKEAKKPAHFSDLWSATYKGRVGVPAYAWYGMLWLHAINKTLGGTEDNIQPGLNAIADLVKKNDAVIVQNVEHGMRLLESGDVVIMPYLNGRVTQLAASGSPIQFEFVDGTVAMGNGYSVLKGSPNAAAAQRFVNATLDQKNQIEFCRWSKYPPANSKCKLPPDLESVKIPDGALDRAAQLDWAKINTHRSAYEELWSKVVLS